MGSRLITVPCKYGHKHVVEAHVFGEWAASRRMNAVTCSMSPDDWWTVTHVPSGLCIAEAGALTVREALAAAEELSTSVPHLVSWDEVPADVSKRIRAALAWAREAA